MSDSDTDDDGDVHIAADQRDMNAQRHLMQFETFSGPSKGNAELGRMLHTFVKAKDAAAVRNFLAENQGVIGKSEDGLNVSWPDPKNDMQTPLHLAAEDGMLQIAQMLVDSGADVNAQNGFALTPIALTSPEYNEAVFELLSARETGKLFHERARAMAQRNANMATNLSGGSLIP
jgi:ankyrin repeat protein